MRPGLFPDERETEKFDYLYMEDGFPLTNPAANKTLLDSALLLTNAKDLQTRTFGWAAIRALCKRGGVPNEAAAAGVEAIALREKSSLSLSVLVALYQNRSLRNGAIEAAAKDAELQGEHIENAFFAAVLAELQDPEVSDGVVAAAGNDRFTSIRRTALKAVVGQPLDSEELRDLLQSDPENAVLGALGLAKSAKMRKVATDSMLQGNALLQLLFSWRGDSERAIDGILQRATGDAGAVLLQSVEQSYSVPSLLMGMPKVEPIAVADPVPDRFVKVEPSGAAHVKYAGGTGRIDTGQNIKPDSKEHADFITDFGMDATWTIFAMFSHVDGVAPNLESNRVFPFFAGFQTFVRNVFLPEMPNVPVCELGLRCKQFNNTYDPVSNDIRYDVKIGFRPGVDTKFVAVRTIGNISSAAPFRCVSGVLNHNGAPATERNSAWEVFSVTPNQSLQFEQVISTKFLISLWTPAHPELYVPPASNSQFQVVQIIEINEANAKLLPGAGSPIELTLDAGSNPLLVYVARVRDALAAGGWFQPNGADPEKAAALALVRLGLAVQVLSTEISQSVPEAVENEIQSKERSHFLAAALPVIAYEIFQCYAAKIEHDLLLTGALLPKITATRNKVSEALRVLSSLSASEQNTLLSEVGSSARLGAGAAIDDLDSLAVALFGAQEQIAQLETEMGESFAIRKKVLVMLQNRDSAKELPMQSDPDILGLT